MTYLLDRCLPLPCRSNWADDWQATAYKGLRNLLFAVPGEQVGARVVLQFAFDFCGANGHLSARDRWNKEQRDPGARP